jgi:hypothetical protein
MRSPSSAARRQLRRHIQAVLTGAALGAGLIAMPAHAATYHVTNTNDNGTGSLRQAILDANANATIDPSNNVVIDGTLGPIHLNSILPALADGTTVTLNGITLSGSDLRADGLGDYSGTGHAGVYDITNGSITGNLIANGGDDWQTRGEIKLNDSTVTGNATTDNHGHIRFDESTLNGSITANGDSAFGLHNSQANGTVTVNDIARVYVDDDSNVTGNVTTNDSSEFDLDNSSVTGDVTANDSSEVYVYNGSITGNLTAHDSSYAEVHDGSTVGGNVYSDGNDSHVSIGYYSDNHSANSFTVGTLVSGELQSGTGDIFASKGGSISVYGSGYGGVDNVFILGNVLADGRNSEIDITGDVEIGNKLSNGALQAGTGNVTATNGGYVSVGYSPSTILGNVSADGDGSEVDVAFENIGTLDGGVLQNDSNGNLTGNVSATNNGYVSVDGSNIYGNVTADGANDNGYSEVEIDDSNVGTINYGNYELQSGTGNVNATNGGNIYASDSNIYGNVTAGGFGNGDYAYVELEDSTVGYLHENTLYGGNISVTNGGGINLDESTVYGNATASGDSWIDFYGSQLGTYGDDEATLTGTGNLTANDNSEIYVDDDTNILGDVIFNDHSLFFLDYKYNYFNNGTGTTSFNDTSIFAPDVQEGYVSVNNLNVADTAVLRPYFSHDFLLNGVNVSNDDGVTNHYAVLGYNARTGTFANIVSPLDVGVRYTDPVGGQEPEQGQVQIYLKSNTVDFNKLPGNENERSVGKFMSNYINHYQGMNGADPNQLSLSGLPTFGDSLADGLLNASAIAEYIDDATDWGDLSTFDEIAADGEIFSHSNAQAYWTQKSFVDSIRNNLYQASSAGGDNPLYEPNMLAGASNPGIQLASLRQAMAPSYAGLGVDGHNGSTANHGVWATFNGSHQSTDADSGVGSNDWSSSSHGFTLGYTGGGDKFSWGVAAGHQKSSLSFNDIDASGDQEGWNAGLYGSLKGKSTYLTGILGYGKYDNDTYSDDLDTTKSKNKATSISLEFGKHLGQSRKGGLTPYASVLWTNIKQDEANVGGSGSGVVLQNGSNHVFTTELGARYNHRMFDKSGTLKGGWQAGLAWLHQGGDTGLASSFGFYDNTGATVPVGNFSIKGTPLSGNSLVVRLGAYGHIHNNVIGFAGYQGTFGSSQKINGINAGIGYQF